MNTTFSNQILYNIIRHVEDNLDKVCMLMTCKALFAIRDNVQFKVFNEESDDDLERHYQNQYDHMGAAITTPMNMLKGAYYNSSKHVMTNPIDTSMKTTKPTIVIYNGERLEIGKIPCTVERVILNALDSGTSISNGIVPESVKVLCIGGRFNGKIEGNGALPKGLKRLELSNSFNQSFAANTLPDTLESLRLGGAYNSAIYVHPSRCTLPSQLVHLEFGVSFNKPLPPGALPATLKSVVFGDRFDMPLLVGSLPAGLESLTFKDYYRAIDKGVLPPNLLHYEGSGVLEERLPSSLVSVSIDMNQSTLGIGILQGLTKLETLSIGMYVPQDRQTTNLIIPRCCTSLTHLSISSAAATIENAIPPSVTSLSLFLRYSAHPPLNATTAYYLPPNLKSIDYTQCSVTAPPHLLGLPQSLEQLYLPRDYNHPLDQLNLPNLTHLQTNTSYPIPHFPKLQYLKMSRLPPVEQQQISLPPTIQELELSPLYSTQEYIYLPTPLPESCKTLTLCDTKLRIPPGTFTKHLSTIKITTDKPYGLPSSQQINIRRLDNDYLIFMWKGSVCGGGIIHQNQFDQSKIQDLIKL
ncbi:hypothetical protein DFA_12050 [Cavenderia fasciculata]|uniref:FNIP repeat-containing protein n=1 Tax=Cavenderia fasciculata TaxID=261658 RepID=F4QFH9_CACFS|nr:uncharacterized protein DFA_12050 [Cavenderia fasciculata]EGG14280.1 hypothetical protein DFA_12050 [Cavenderia fasciculata]|eukprot:XP_004350989.1 hypothetical protein DFA_12050 [Cavenderia fasciculata]